MKEEVGGRGRGEKCSREVGGGGGSGRGARGGGEE